VHPVTNEFMKFEAAIPSDMLAAVDKWSGYVQNKTRTE
jgi:hypothetical protein